MTKKLLTSLTIAVTVIFGAQMADATLLSTLQSTKTSKKLKVPIPKASKGKYKGYVKISWSKISGASGYYVFRSTTASWSTAKSIKKITKKTTVSFNDKSASSSGKKYYYWVCPYAKNTYYYNAGAYASGYRKAAKKKKSTSSSYYISDKNGKKLGSSISLGIGGSKILNLRTPAGKIVSANWIRSNGNVSDNKVAVSDTMSSYMIRAMKPGTTTISAFSGSKEYKLKVTIVGGGGSSSGYYISGSSTIPYGTTKKYELYYNGKRLTNVSWKMNSYLRKVVVSSGVLSVKPTSRPVSTYSSAVHAYVGGKKVASKSVKITR